MLTGKKLGAAIKVAIDKKLASGAVQSKAAIARHFGVKPPSIHDWIKKGSISKDKLPELWKFFSDVVGPEHWGLPESPNDAASRADVEAKDNRLRAWAAYDRAKPETRAVVDAVLGIGKRPPWLDESASDFIDILKSKAKKVIDERKNGGAAAA